MAQRYGEEAAAATRRVAEAEDRAPLAVASHEARSVLGALLDVVEGERHHRLLHGGGREC